MFNSFWYARFGRSESTPELHRIRKLDHSLHTGEKNITQDKSHYNNVLQESNVSNLLTLTSDSLPDIFRKPIIQQQHDIPLNLQSKFGNSEDKVSKWGYGPSSTNTQQGFGSKINNPESHKVSYAKLFAEEHVVLPQVKEEGPHTGILQTPLPEARNEYPSLSHLEKSSFSTCKLPSVLSETEESMSAFIASKDKSGLNSTSDTASALGLPTQPTVKVHRPVDQEKTPLAKRLTWTGHSSLSKTKVKEPSIVSLASTSKTELQNDEQKPLSNILLPKVNAETSLLFNTAGCKPLLSVPIKSAAVVAEVQPVNPIQRNIEPQSKLIPPASNNNLLPPPNARPTPKTKQIAVNGKLYTVMKPLGRGGSSIVYQVKLKN